MVDSIKAKNPTRFQRTSLFLRVLSILELHHFRLPVCRFVIDLFDKKVMRRIVLEEDVDDATESDGEGDLFDDEEDGVAFGKVASRSSLREQVLFDDEEDEDRVLFGDAGGRDSRGGGRDSRNGGRDSRVGGRDSRGGLRRNESGANIITGVNRSDTAILRGSR